MTNDPIVAVDQGMLQGARKGALCVFRNVPYASARRFEAPRPADAWDGVRSAVEPGPICPQRAARLEFLMGSPSRRRPQSEDCQVLSIWSPDLTGKRAVMVWIHGGAYLSGGGEEAWYDASRLAEQGDVVTVTITYRLGALGYLHAPSPDGENLGLQDQVAALAWVRDNIARFGGDPDCVTVFGQSAGAHSIAAMLASPGPRLFRRAILQSLPGQTIARQAAADVRAGLSGALAQPIGQSKAEDLLVAQQKVVQQARGGMSFGPVDIDVLQPAIQPNAGPLDVMLTWARDDAAPFIAMRRKPDQFGSPIDRLMTAVMTRRFFANPARTLAARLRGAGRRVSTYEIDWRPRGSRFGAAHCVELPLLLGREADWAEAPILGSEPRADVELFGAEARAIWATFAKTGAPPERTAWLKPKS